MDGILQHYEDTKETIPLEWHPNKIKTIITKPLLQTIVLEITL